MSLFYSIFTQVSPTIEVPFYNGRYLKWYVDETSIISNNTGNLTSGDNKSKPCIMLIVMHNMMITLEKKVNLEIKIFLKPSVFPTSSRKLFKK